MKFKNFIFEIKSITWMLFCLEIKKIAITNLYFASIIMTFILMKLSFLQYNSYLIIGVYGKMLIGGN